MLNKKKFDVLCIKGDKAEIIQALIGNDCLGSFIDNGTSKLYFIGGSKKNLESKLHKINLTIPFKWKWENQIKEDWHLAWQDNFKPIIIDDQLEIIPHWQEKKEGNIVVKIKPGMAFGTGHHETTSLILSQMLKYIEPNMSILDLGTGSGILSICAMKMGSNNVDAVENDIDCKSNFKENLKLNNIKNGITYHHKDVLNWNTFEYDIILVNINHSIINKLIPKIQSISARVILSGLLKENYSDIKILLKKHSIKIIEKVTNGEWLCLNILCQ